MEHRTYPNDGYPENNVWTRWVQDNMQGHIPSSPMPAPPPVREDPYNTRTNLEAALITIGRLAEVDAADRALDDHLFDAAPCEEDRGIIAGIRDDKTKRFKLFRQLYYDITGEKLPREKAAAVQLPASYGEGLAKALMDVQSAVRAYKNVLYAMRSRRHVNLVTEIITDALRHLGLYNYLYSKNRGV